MLTNKQKLFCHYFKGECAGNATEAAIKAGYSKKSAARNTTQILKSKEVQEYLKNLTDEIMKNYAESVVEIKKYKIASIAEIQEFWTEIMNSNREETKDRLKASELLAKANGAFNSEW